MFEFKHDQATMSDDIVYSLNHDLGWVELNLTLFCKAFGKTVRQITRTRKWRRLKSEIEHFDLVYRPGRTTMCHGLFALRFATFIGEDAVQVLLNVPPPPIFLYVFDTKKKENMEGIYLLGCTIDLHLHESVHRILSPLGRMAFLIQIDETSILDDVLLVLDDTCFVHRNGVIGSLNAIKLAIMTMAVNRIHPDIVCVYKDLLKVSCPPPYTA